MRTTELEYTGPVAAPGEPPYYRVDGGDEDPWYEGPPAQPYGEKRDMNETEELSELYNAALGEIDELKAKIRRVEAQIAEELTHGPLATYYAWRFQAALNGEVSR